VNGLNVIAMRYIISCAIAAGVLGLPGEKAISQESAAPPKDLAALSAMRKEAAHRLRRG
jgi:hypothetical protein